MKKKILIGIGAGAFVAICFGTVSYTHLDVYKRQPEAPEQG